MPHKKAHAEEEAPGESVGLWYISFSDMITLLLSFFVMLTTFSSFSKESLDKFSGAWAYIANYSVFPVKNINQDSLIENTRYIDWSPDGSEKPPADMGLDAIRRPRDSFWMENMANAYHDRRMFYIPSSRLFWGKGSSLIPAGKAHLDKIASFMKLVPCTMIVGESNSEELSMDGRAFERAWAIIEYVSARAGIGTERFSIASIGNAAAGQMDQSVMEVTLMAGSIGQ